MRWGTRTTGLVIALALAGAAALAPGCSREPTCQSACDHYLACVERTARDAGLVTNLLSDEPERFTHECVRACGADFQPLRDAASAMPDCASLAPRESLRSEPDPHCAELVAGLRTLCAGSLDPTEQDRCKAAVDSSPDCPRVLLPSLEAFSAYGKTLALPPAGGEATTASTSGSGSNASAQSLERSPAGGKPAAASARGTGPDTSGAAASARGTGPDTSGVVPLVRVALEWLAVPFWLVLGLWLAAALSRAWRVSRRGALAACGLALLAVTVSLLVAHHGPINFAEYERLFLPPADDLSRLAYSGFSLVASRFAALTGLSFELLYGLNAVFLGLLTVAVFSVALDRLGSVRAAVWAAALVAASPVALRLSATAGETLGFALVTVVFLDIWGRRGWPRLAVALPLLAPLVAVFRPEGVLFLVPLALDWACSGAPRSGTCNRLTTAEEKAPHGKSSSGPASPGGEQSFWASRLRLAIRGLVLLELLAFLVLYLAIPVPGVPLALLVRHARDLVLDLVHPLRFSALLLPVLLGSAVVSRPARAWAAWTLVLLAVWTMQGTEGNVVFGSARYLVMAVPWMALGATALSGGAGSGIRAAAGRGWAVPAVVLLSMLPQVPLVTVETDTQIELAFARQAADRVPDRALVLIPALPPDDRQISPEAPLVTALSLAGRTASWMPLAEAADRIQRRDGLGVAEVFIYTGFYRDDDALARVVRGHRVEVVLERTLSGRPDVAWYRERPPETPVTLQLLRWR